MKNTKNVNNMLIDLLKEEEHRLEIYHFRSFSTPSYGEVCYYSHKHIQASKEQIPQIADYLHGGFTVVVLVDQDNLGTCAISKCSSGDMFNKSIGLNIALKRLYSYINKPSTCKSWKYNPHNFFSIEVKEGVDPVDTIVKHLNQDNFILNSNERVIL